ncbi:MAG: nitrate reductase [Actinomycetes bacterium]
MAVGPLLGQRPDPVPPDVVTRLRGWVRAAAGLAPDDVVTVTQLVCRDSGCAPVETVLAVLHPGAPLRRVLPMRAAEVSEADIRTAFTDLAGSSS